MKNKSQFGLSLNSAFFGFYAHAGFMKGIEELKLVPSLLTGCSAGAIIASLYAAKIPMNEVCDFLLELKKEDFWEGTKLHQLVKPLKVGFKNYTGILTGSQLKKLLFPFLGNKKIEDLPIRLGIAVANLTKQKRELIQKGNILDAILASSAFPLMFEIQKINGEDFTDGGLVDHEPIKEMILDKKITKIFSHKIHSKKEISKNALLRSVRNGLHIIESETDDLKNEIAKLMNKKLVRLVSETNSLNENNLKLGKENMEIGYKTFLNNRNMF